MGVPACAFGLILFVGGSVQIPLGVMTAELAATLVLGWWLATARLADWRAAVPVLIVVAAILAIGAIQLVPLPSDTWAGLPGRERAVSIAKLTGTFAARPLSLDPDATFADLLYTVLGIPVALVAICARPREVRALILVVIGMTAFSAVLGALQIAGGHAFYPYPYSHLGNGVGIFANRNHNADFLMIGMILLAGQLRDRKHFGSLRMVAMGVAVLLAIATVMTASRLGMAILPLSMIASVLLITAKPGSPFWLPFAMILLLAVAAALLVVFNPAVYNAIARYGSIGDDGRYVIWETTRHMIVDYWPVGTGLGTFVPVYNSHEVLETLTQHYVVDAHDDYLELILELGAAGVALIVLYLCALIWAVVRNIGSRRQDQLPAIFGIAILLAHSLGDYPLRTPTLMAVFGLLNGIVFARSGATKPPVRADVPQ